MDFCLKIEYIDSSSSLCLAQYSFRINMTNLHKIVRVGKEVLAALLLQATLSFAAAAAVLCWECYKFKLAILRFDFQLENG